MSRRPILHYPSFTPTIIRRPDFNTNIHASPEIFNRIVCPYDPNAFAFFLDKHNLASSYPNLVDNMRNGFPLGPMLQTFYLITKQSSSTSLMSTSI
jgi:hypothetical protein